MPRHLAILLLLTLCIAHSASAQSTGLSEEDIIRYYGSPEEYQYGYKLVSSSPTQQMVFAGHVVSWVTLAAGYLEAHCGCTIHDQQGQLLSRSDSTTLYIQAHCPLKDIDFKVSKSSPGSAALVDSISITGDAEALACLFLGYWQNTTIPKSKLKKGALETLYFITDRITFNWKGPAPIISIRRNPDYKGD